MFGKTKESVDRALADYERRRRLDIDEKLSEYRRSEKNKAMDEVKSFQDSRAETLALRHKEQAEHNAKKLEREVTIAKLDGEIVARKAVAETQESHRKLTADARKENMELQVKAAEEKADIRVKAAEVATSKAEGQVESLRSTIATFVADGGKNVSELIRALGEAAGKDHSTKVVGLGVTAVNAEKKA